eukprot:TRINITY_DN4978_c0_g1_i1.p1 TRINITY_DN4978_c0_g1~~TRINITY_DN4978_c0_g1_i1.p1  ORF type:complete len:605 (+),score=98.70 TRINITY_DN4978_c0_g1_i1:227-2041(+)
MKDYNFVPTYDSYLTGDGIHRTSARNMQSLESVERYIYSKHKVMLTSGPSTYIRFRTDTTTPTVTLGRLDRGARYLGLLDEPDYGPDNRLGFEMEYRGVFCGGLSRHYGVTGSISDGSGMHNYYPGEYCLFWIRAVDPSNVTNATMLANSTNLKLELTFGNTSIHRSDLLRVLDGNTTSANVVQAYHNTYTNHTPFSVTTTSNVSDGILIEFATDLLGEAFGFNMSWKLVDVDPAMLCTAAALHNLSAPYGTFSDHAGDFTSYRNSMDCHWQIQLESYVQQIELFVEDLALHTGKSWDYFNSSGLAQQGILRVGESHHPYADWLAVYSAHRATGDLWDPATMLANYTGSFTVPVYNTENASDVPQPLAYTFNGTKAGAWFHSTSAYADKGFTMRYQAVYSNVTGVEASGEGLYTAALGKAASITLRTTRSIYAGLKDIRTGVIHNESTAAAAEPWYMTQGGAVFRVRLCQDANRAACDKYVVGEVVDLKTGFYLLSYSAQKIGTYTLTIEMYTHPSTGYGAPVWREVHGSPYSVTVSIGAVHVNGSTVTGSGLYSATPGALREFTITAGDTFGNLIPHGGHRFVGKVDGPSSVACVIKLSLIHI